MNKMFIACVSLFLSSIRPDLVGTKGLEPLQYHYWQILSLLRLPIPPRPLVKFLRILSQHLEKCQRIVYYFLQQEPFNLDPVRSGRVIMIAVRHLAGDLRIFSAFRTYRCRRLFLRLLYGISQYRLSERGQSRTGGRKCRNFMKNPC